MKKIGIVMSALLVLSMTGVLADTQIWSEIANSGGITKYSEVTTVGGYDWSEGANVVTGVVSFALENNGAVQLKTYANQPSDWVVEKYESATGDGNTEIFKQMAVWTEDTTLWENGNPQYRNPDGVAGELAYPTQAWVNTKFQTNVPFFDEENAYFLMKDAPAESNIGVFTKLIQTKDMFNFESKQGIGIEPCFNVVMPKFTPYEFCVDC